jgi:decaprenyl-phosphate phosphoribosyltransferase
MYIENAKGWHASEALWKSQKVLQGIMSKISPFVEIARPHQYIKNAFVFRPLFFSASIHHLEACILTFWAFLAFCSAASSVYILNDLRDAKEDQTHPHKKNRPLASDKLTPRMAVSFMIILLGISILIAILFLPLKFSLVLSFYLILNLAYSLVLKHHAIVDIVCIGIGFVLRVFGGGAVADIPISRWIILMTFLLAVFLSLAKRLDDLLIVSQTNGNIRKSLDGYNQKFVSSGMILMASVVIVSYIMYTVSPEVIAKHGAGNLYLTSIWVIIGLFRYLQITLVEQRSGSPTLIVLHDRFIQAIILLWIATFGVLIYGKYLSISDKFQNLLMRKWL